MAGVMETISNTLIEGYNLIALILPEWAQRFLNLFLIIVLIFLYALFIWKLYKFISTKNIFGFNLNKYNKSQHPFFTKLLAGSFYFIEYIIILPFMIFFWFSIFSFFLILLTEDLTLGALLLISAAVVGAIRISAYYNEDLSKELAKLIPFTLLAVSLLKPGFFNIERVFAHLSELPEFINTITIYLIFIIGLEIVLRFFDFIFSLLGVNEPESEEADKEANEETDEEESEEETEETN